MRWCNDRDNKAVYMQLKVKNLAIVAKIIQSNQGLQSLKGTTAKINNAALKVSAIPLDYVCIYSLRLNCSGDIQTQSASNFSATSMILLPLNFSATSMILVGNT